MPHEDFHETAGSAKHSTVQSSEEFEINSAYKPQMTLPSYVVNEVIPQ